MNRGDYGDRSDVYSFGMVLWTILTATLPYENWDNITPRHTAVRVIEVRLFALSLHIRVSVTELTNFVALIIREQGLNFR